MQILHNVSMLSTRDGELPLQERNDALEGVEAKRRSNGGTQVRVGVDVVEHAPAVGCLQVLDAADVEPGGVDDSPRGCDSLCGNFGIGIELDRQGLGLVRHYADAG